MDALHLVISRTSPFTPLSGVIARSRCVLGVSYDANSGDFRDGAEPATAGAAARHADTTKKRFIVIAAKRHRIPMSSAMNTASPSNSLRSSCFVIDSGDVARSLPAVRHEIDISGGIFLAATPSCRSLSDTSLRLYRARTTVASGATRRSDK